MDRDPIEKPLREILGNDRVPPFGEMWSQAEIAVTQKQREAAPLGRLLVPGLALAGIGGLVLVAYWTLASSNTASFRSQRVDDQVQGNGALTELEEIQSVPSVFDGLNSDWNIEPDMGEANGSSPGDEVSSLGDETEIAATTAPLGEGLAYESPTDFLLEMDVPEWRELEERSVL